VGFVVDKVALGHVFSEYLGFPCQFSFHRLPHTHHHLPSRTGTIGQIVANVVDSVSHQTKKLKKKKKRINIRHFGDSVSIPDDDIV
jgi:hypothetical protein